MLNSHSCDVFNRPFFQFAQLKKYQPEAIESIKASYKHHWQIWQQLIHYVANDLGAPFAAPHIERWCNGWQVRAHFFAYFKYEHHQNAAVILSVLLNRRRLTVSLDWHSYKAKQSTLPLDQYNQWLTQLDNPIYANFDLWHGAASEYDDYLTVVQQVLPRLPLSADDFYCIGKHIERDQLAHTDCVAWISQTIKELVPLYEYCFD